MICFEQPEPMGPRSKTWEFLSGKFHPFGTFLTPLQHTHAYTFEVWDLNLPFLGLPEASVSNAASYIGG